MDFDEILAAVAPRSVLVVAPELDRYAHVDDVRSEVDRSRRVYVSLGRPDALRLETPRDFSRFPRSVAGAGVRLVRRIAVSCRGSGLQFPVAVASTEDMPPMCRRTFFATMGAAAVSNRLYAAGGSTAVDDALRSGVARRKIPAVVGMVGSENKTLYSGAFGTRDSSGVPVRVDSVFRIASMTKAITTVAALQLVERGKVDLDEPLGRRLPKLAHLDVLEGFDAAGRPSLRPAKTAVTLRHLLTHTSGMCYATWDGKMRRFTQAKVASAPAEPGPLMFEPGTRWQYGEGVDWAGRLVETISGATLEDYFQQQILRPLGMVDTSYILPAAKFDRLVNLYHREANGVLQEDERKFPRPPTSFNGGGGLYSSAPDYIRFTQMILNARHRRTCGSCKPRLCRA